LPREGGVQVREGRSPSLKSLPPLLEEEKNTKGESKRGETLRGNPPESPFAKGGGLLPFLKGEREGFKQGRGTKGEGYLIKT